MMKLRKILLTCALGAGLTFVLTGCGSKTIDLNKYVTIEAEGYDTMGTLNYSFDYDAFENDYDGKIKANVKGSDGGTAAEIALELSFGAEVWEALLDSCVSYQVDKWDDLSNGDTVTFTWDCEDADAKKFFNCSLKYSDIQYKVKGLKEVGTFDPFAYVTIEFSGVSPDGTAVVSPNYDKSEMQYLTVYADKNSGLSNGDKVTVTANVQGSVDSFVEQFGAIPNPLSKEFTVEGLTSYVSSAAEIDQEALDAMKKQAEDVLLSETDWAPDELKGYPYLGYYLLCRKEGFRGEANYVLLVHKVETEWEGVSYSYYYPTKFRNVVINADGSCSVDLSKYELSNSRYYIKPDAGLLSEYYNHGYATLDELYADCVQSQIDAYTYENHVSE